MTNKERRLAAALLSDYAADLGRRSCYDWEFPSDWTREEREEFCREYEAYNGTPEEFNPKHLALPNFAVAGFLAWKLTAPPANSSPAGGPAGAAERP